MYNFLLRNKQNGMEMIVVGIGKTASEAKTRLLIYNLANTDFSVWELGEIL